MESRLKKGLGRGLSSLLGDSSRKISTNKVSIKDINRNKLQPRKHFDKDALEEFILPMIRRIELNRGVDIYGEAIEEENDISSDFE